MSETGGARVGDWRRTSPLSFVVRAITGLRNLLFPALALLFGSRGMDDGEAFVIPAIAFMVLISAILTWIAWRHFRYRLGEEDIRVEHGLLSRSARTVPYERIQDVSLEQALVPRLFGMVEVKFETGAGGKDELKLAYVTEAEGAALREAVRVRKSGEAVEAAESADFAVPAEESAHTLFAMGARRLALFGIFEFSLVIFAVLGGLAQQFDSLLSFDLWDLDRWLRLLAGPGHWLAELGPVVQMIGVVLALGVLALIGLATGIVRTVLRDWRFRLEETPKGLRRRRGLLTRTDVVMPLHRVQALKVTTGMIRRRFGWHGLEVVSLGLDEKSGSHVVVPFATIDEIAPVVRVTGFDLPSEGLEWRRASARYRRNNAALRAGPMLLLAIVLATVLPPLAAALPVEARFPLFLPSIVLAALAGFLAVRARFLWKHEQHAMDGARLYARHGWLAPRLDIAAPIKLQSVEIAQGPLARRGGYASLRFGVAGGTLALRGIPLAEARAIRDAVLASIAPVDFSRLPG